MKRWKLVCEVVAVALALTAPLVHAQSFPSKSIRMIVGFPPGGPADISARAVADGMGTALGQPVIVENRPGAGSVPAIQSLLSSAPDGHTLMMGSNVLATGKWLYKSVTIDPRKDLRAVVGVSRSPHLVVVATSFPGNGINDLIRMAKEKPGKVNYASAGAGTMPHLGTELFKQVTGTQMTHVPYKGSGAALPAVMGGQVDVYFDILFSATSLVKGGKLKALGVTSRTRWEAFPGVPTLEEQGLAGFELYSWFGLVARPETPEAALARLNEAANKVLQSASVRERLSSLGAAPIGGSPQAFQKMIDTDYETWGKVIRAAGMRAE